MKNKIKAKNIIGIILISIIFVLTTNVYASTDSFKTSLSANHSTVKRGENVIVTISLSDIAIESGEKGIGAYTAHLDFDSSVFEYVKANGANNWETPLYQDAYIEGITQDGEVVKTSQSIGSITFKVKDDAKLGQTTIKLTDFDGSNAAFDITAADSLVTITITAKEEESQGGNGSQSGNENQGGSGSQGGTGNQSGNGSQGGSENQGGAGNQSGNGSQSGNASQGETENQTENEIVNGNGSTQNGETNNNKPNESATNKEDIKPGTLPQTGKSNIAIFITIGVLLVLAISCLIRIKILKKKK